MTVALLLCVEEEHIFGGHWRAVDVGGEARIGSGRTLKRLGRPCHTCKARTLVHVTLCVHLTPLIVKENEYDTDDLLLLVYWYTRTCILDFKFKYITLKV